MADGKIKCMNCIHFYITWDRNFPRGCKAHGFKSKYLPSITVKKSSGMDCLYFVKKAEKN